MTDSFYIVNIPSTSLVRKEPEVYPTSYAHDNYEAAIKKARELTRGRHNVSVRIDDQLYVLSWYVVVQAMDPDHAAKIVKNSDQWTRLRKERPTVYAYDDD